MALARHRRTTSRCRRTAFCLLRRPSTGRTLRTRHCPSSGAGMSARWTAVGWRPSCCPGRHTASGSIRRCDPRRSATRSTTISGTRSTRTSAQRRGASPSWWSSSASCAWAPAARGGHLRGSGQIPFEAARLGCDVYASDLNPVACMLTWGAFNIVGGSPEAREDLLVAQRGLVERVEAEIDRLGIETDGHGWRGKVFLYCVEVTCPQIRLAGAAAPDAGGEQGLPGGRGPRARSGEPAIRRRDPVRRLGS